MFTAVLGAHDSVVSIYEPWNANQKAIASGQKIISLHGLVDEGVRQKPGAHLLVLKETAANLSYPDHLAKILDQVHPPMARHLFILLRDPFHVFLSEIEGRRKWWGEQNLQISQQVFNAWTNRSRQAYLKFFALAEAYSGSFVVYESSVAAPQLVFTAVMEDLSLQFNDSQLRISKNTDLTRIRGDRSLVENARDVEQGSISKRRHELADVEQVLSHAPLFSMFNEVRNLIGSVGAHGIVTRADREWPLLIERARSILALPADQTYVPIDRVDVERKPI